MTAEALVQRLGSRLVFYLGCIVTGNEVCPGLVSVAPEVTVPVEVNEPACVGVTT
jgi:hypothetical protein